MVIIQMILSQVSEYRRAVIRSLHPSLLKCMGGYLHHTALHAFGGHIVQSALKLKRFLRSTGHRIALSVITHLNRPDQPRLHAMVLHDFLNQIRSGGFAVGPGNPNHLHPAAG